jgi:hypothetical protein
MTKEERGQNLIIVAAVEGYADTHRITPLEAFDLFERHDLFQILRDNYSTLHTQSLFEGAYFAEDYLSRSSV